MFKVTKQNDNTMTYVTELIADTEADVSTIPTTDMAPGSTCIVAASSNVYILNTNKEWVQL